ncbi:MAG TPA: hypothetical protein VFA60_14115 [Terriglobales bacterium]|nr:hypothetical protein [Terriglobales bacterium]
MTDKPEHGRDLTPTPPTASGGDAEDQLTKARNAVREKGLDKTLADTFPTSDPPSSIPDPEIDDEAA